MNILVLFGEIAYISRSETLKGIVDVAKEDGHNVFLFTCEGFLYHNLKQYSAGEYEIFKLPDFNKYDGAIVDFNSIQDENTKAYLKTQINESKIPCVSFENSIPNASEIIYNSTDAFKEVVEHLIKVHECKNIHYISGPEGNNHSQRRLEAFKEVMKKNRLKIDKNSILYGDFNFVSGISIADKYIEEKLELPDAFVVANDYMAIGLIEEFKKYNINCPDDIKVVGVDNCELGQNMTPKLTTVDLGTYEAGVSAYKELISIMSKDQFNKICISGSVSIGNSCGCNSCDNTKITGESFVKLSVQMDESLDLIKALNINLSETATNHDLESKLAPIISKFGIEYFYFCQNGSMESYYQKLEKVAHGGSVELADTYEDVMWCPIVYERGEWRGYPAFRKEDLLPPKHKTDKGIYYIVMPVHRNKHCIGYTIMGNFNWSLSGRVLQHLVLALDRAIGDIHQNDINRTMLARINSKWQIDELTTLYNRSGLYAKMTDMLEMAKKTRQGIVVRFFDLDGLKQINDKDGHKQGDAYLVKMGMILQKLSGHTDISCRFGGDEFIMVSFSSSIEEVEIVNFDIVEAIDKEVSASMGYAFGHVENIDAFNKLIEEADKKMYENKASRKNTDITWK